MAELEPKDVIKTRVKVRESDFPDVLLDEYVTTAMDRILLYTGLLVFPTAFNSIAVEVVVAMYRRKYHEGISSEGVDVFSVSFIENLLEQYDREFTNFKNQSDDTDETTSKAGVIVFL